MDGDDLIARLGDLLVEFNELMWGRLGGLGDPPALIHQPVKAFIVQFNCLQIGLLAKDDVDRDDVVSGSKICNSTLFGNFTYSLNSNTQIGFELSQLETDYKDRVDSDSTRAQLSLIYKF